MIHCLYDQYIFRIILLLCLYNLHIFLYRQNTGVPLRLSDFQTHTVMRQVECYVFISFQDLLISKLCTALGAMQTSFESYCQIHESMKQLHKVQQSGALHSTTLNAPGQ